MGIPVPPMGPAPKEALWQPHVVPTVPVVSLKTLLFLPSDRQFSHALSISVNKPARFSHTHASPRHLVWVCTHTFLTTF